MVTTNILAGTFDDLKMMFKEYAWPNKYRPKILSVEDAQANAVPDRSIIIQLGIARGIEKSGGSVANRALLFCSLAIYCTAPYASQKILDDVYNCIFKTMDGGSPATLWYASNRFTTIQKIVPAQTYSLPVARDPVRQDFFRATMNLGIYVNP